MRRKEKEVTDTQLIESILTQLPVCRIGLVEARGKRTLPYVVPTLFAYRENRLYVHSASEGKKLDLLRKNSLVCVEVDEYKGIIPAEKPCGYSCAYRSVIGVGRAALLEGREEKKRALDLILAKYAGRHTNGSFDFSEATLENTSVLEIELEEVTCKQSGNWGR